MHLDSRHRGQAEPALALREVRLRGTGAFVPADGAAAV